MLLAVDTSTIQMGLALYDDAQVIAEYAWRSGRRHTTELAPAVAELLSRCELTMEDVHALGVALGPGSFTSLRVGLAFVKGLSFAKQIPLIGIPTLEILANEQPPSELPLLCAIQAGRGRFAVGWYRCSENTWQAQGSIRIATLEEIESEVKSPSMICGEFSAEEIQQLEIDHIQLAPPFRSVRRPAVLAELAWARLQNNDVDDPASLAPIYLHKDGSLPA